MNLALHGFLLQVILSMILDSQHGFGLCSAGEPGYLDFDNLPETNFSCQGKVIGGYYADVEAGCQMFHVCTIGQKDEIMDIKFLCLNGTVFDQETRVCERVDEVDCSKSERFYNLNLELYGNNAVTLSLHEKEEEDDDDGLSDSLDDYQHRTSSSRPSTTTTTTTTTSRPSQSSTTPSNNNYQHSTGYPQHYQPQPAFPSVQTSQSKSLYDDKNGGYHHQYIFHNDERNNNQATSYQLFSNQGVSSTTPTPQVHQIRYSSTPPQVIHNEPSTVTPLFHTSSTIQTLLNNNPNGPSIINPIFHNHGIASTTEQYSVHNNNPRETSEYQDNEEEPDEHEEHEERRRLEPIQSTNKGKVSKLTISPVPQQQASRSVIQTMSSQTSQQHRISVNFLPTQTTIQTTSRTFYPTSRTSTKPQKSSNQRVMQQHIHVPPPPLIPNLKHHQITINLSPPDIQKIIQNPPPLLPSQSRVIVTAKASVSDESGRPLNTSQLITLPLPTIPSTYDDYREGDESFDPFYRDVPKIRNDHRIVVSSRSSRSPKWRILFRHKRDTNGNTHYYRKVEDEKSNASDSGIFSANHYNDTEISSIVENLRKFKNIFFGGDFDDSEDYDKLREPTSDFEEPPKYLGSGLRNDNAQAEADYLNKNVNSSMDSVSHSNDTDGEEYMEAGLRENAKEYSESRIQTKSSDMDSRPSINGGDLETKDYDNQDSNSTTTAIKAKESEIEYYDNQDEVSTDRSKDIQNSENVETTTTSDSKSKELEIEYYDDQEEISNSNSKDKILETVNTIKEPDLEEYFYDPDETFLDDIFTTTTSPILEGNTTPAHLDSEKSHIEDTGSSTQKLNDIIVMKNNSKDIAEKEEKPKEVLDTKPILNPETTPNPTLTLNSTSTPDPKLKGRGRESRRRSGTSTTTKASLKDKIESSAVDIEKPKFEEKKLETESSKSETESAKFEAKETKFDSSSITKAPEELLETKSSSNRKKPQSSERVQKYEEEKLTNKGRSKYHEEIESSRLLSKSRRRNLIKSKPIEDPDYPEDEGLIDYEEEERRLERRKQSGRTGSRRKSNSRSRSRPKDYDIEDSRIISRSRSSSNRKSSYRDKRPDLERERARVYHEIGRRRKPVIEEFESEESKSEEPDYQTEDYYTSDEIRTASLEDDYYDDELEAIERKRKERTKARRNKGPRHEEPPPRSKSSHRRENNRRFRDEDLDYDSREVSTLSSREDENTSGWSLEYPTSEEIPEDSQTDIIEEDYTEDSRDHGDVTTSAKNLSSEEVTSSVEDETETIEEVTGKTESTVPDSDIEEEKTKGVLKFMGELPKVEQKDEAAEKDEEKPVKEGEESSGKDMHDYVDDNYEPENYKQHKGVNDESVKQNSKEVQEQNDRKNEEVELKDAMKTDIGNEETNKNKFDEANLNEIKLNKTNLDETKLNETRLEETTTPPSSTTTPTTTTTTAKTTSRITRSTTTKVTARTTPPKLFKPLTGKRNYLYIPPSTTPVPVVIKRRISLVHPRPAKPPKSYNELAPKPVIRKKLLEARKAIIATTVTSTTQEYENENYETPPESSEISKSQMKDDNIETSEVIPPSDDKVNLRNKTEMLKTNDYKKGENEKKGEQKEEKKEQTEEKKEQKEEEKEMPKDSRNTSSTTPPAIENFTSYPYLLSRLSNMATSIEKIETEELKKTKKIPTEEPATLVPPEMDTTIKLTTMVPKSENLEPHSESTKAEVTLIRTSANQKTSKRTTKIDPGSVSGPYQGFNCLGKEMYRFYGDKRDCRLFHYCSPGFTSTQVLDFKFVCEQGTYFDEMSQSCRHDYKNPDCTVRIFW